MRYHSTEPDFYVSQYGKIYICSHPLYDRCTLYQIGPRGLAVIQQRFDPATKRLWWTEIDPWLTDPIYLHPRFKPLFDERAAKPDANGLCPTITVRQLMWALRMKPLRKERWETVFDRRDI